MLGELLCIFIAQGAYNNNALSEYIRRLCFAIR